MASVFTTDDVDEAISMLRQAKYPSAETLKKLCAKALEILSTEPNVVRVTPPVTVCGDTHGQFFDLLELFSIGGQCPDTNYLFLGDYVDRGEFSLEVITLLFALKLALPSSIFLIRGNHEFMHTNAKYGFKQQVLAEYDEELYNLFNEAFSYMPLAAFINSKYFAVHGGISADLINVKDICEIPRPLVSECDAEEFAQLVTDLVWSDPIAINALYLTSPRGFGCLFGRDAIECFLERSGVFKIIRAHQCVQNGFESILDDKLITVFSSSNYSTAPPNKAGSLRIENDIIEIVRASSISMY